MNLSPEEQTLIENAQSGLKDAKTALRSAKKAMRGVMDIQEKAGRTEAYSAAYRVWVELDKALNGTHCAHATATEAMTKTYDDEPSGIVLFGGGGGR